MKKLSVLLCCLFCMATLAGCGGSSSGGETAAASSAAAQNLYSKEAAVEDMAYDEAVPEEEAADAGAGPAAIVSGQNQPNRKKIWRAWLSLETLEFDSAIEKLTAAVNAAGGYLESSSVEGNSIESYGPSRRYGTLTARVPSDKLDGFIGEVGGICNVLSSNLSSEDITLQYTDTETRKKSLEVEQERLLALLEKAEDLESIIKLEEPLSEVRYQLDGKTSELRAYDHLVDYSTVTMELHEVRKVSEQTPETVPERISTGLSNTFGDMKEAGTNLFVGFVVNLPYLLILGVVVLLAVLLIRRLVKKERTRTSAAPLYGGAKLPNPYTAPEEKGDTPQQPPKDE